MELNPIRNLDIIRCFKLVVFFFVFPFDNKLVTVVDVENISLEAVKPP